MQSLMQQQRMYFQETPQPGPSAAHHPRSRTCSCSNTISATDHCLPDSAPRLVNLHGVECAWPGELLKMPRTASQLSSERQLSRSRPLSCWVLCAAPS